MDAFTDEWLRDHGFEGFDPFDGILEGSVSLPSAGGVYVVTISADQEPRFTESSTGGHFKQRDPEVDVAILEAKWVRGAHVVYIGKANELDRRLRELARFGAGAAIGHWGGRYLWQLADVAELRVAWLETPDRNPRGVESEYLAEFAAAFDGRLPFANLTR
jgi:hypothetical protein